MSAAEAIAPRVAVAMGSQSDLDTMRPAAEMLASLGVAAEVRIVSAHRTPKEMIAFGEELAGRGIEVVIAGAGGAAHLPGMLAAVTDLPVIGVPVPLRHLDGIDSLLSIVQMPTGVPVATVAIGAAGNAGILAARIIAGRDPAVARAVREHREATHARATASDRDASEILAPSREPAG
jgi:5-(carboxyamino)imidazole ribonucleotide mutase